MGDSAGGRSQRFFVVAFGVGSAAIFLFCLAAYLRTAGLLAHLPYEIDYGEGIVWQQMRMIIAGHGYGAIDQFPAIVFHYPPLYHVSAALVSKLAGIDQLLAGRTLSVASTLIGGAIVAAIAGRVVRFESGRMAAWICGAWAGLIALSLPNVLMWAAFMRVDMLFVALSLGGFYFGIRALTEPKAVHFAAVLFVGAIFTKQTAIAAPAAVFGTLLYLRPQTALRGIVTTLVVSVIALIPVMVFSDGGFFRHIIMYNVNRINIENGRRTFSVVKASWPYCAVVAWAIFARLSRVAATRPPAPGADLRASLNANPGDASFLMLRVYFVIATVMLLLVFKSGASTNYYLEWQFLLGIYAGIAVFETVFAGNELLKPLYRLAIVCAALAYVGWRSVTSYTLFDGYYDMIARQRGSMLRLESLVRDADKPVISDNMVALLRGGKDVQWEPAIFAELAHKGIWDERPFVAMIKARKFAFFVTSSCPGDKVLYDTRYNPEVSAAMMAAYPVQRALGEYHLHFPVGGLPAAAESMRTSGSCAPAK